MLSRPAVSVLQKAGPEEEIQKKSATAQLAGPEEELQKKSAPVQKAGPEEEIQKKSSEGAGNTNKTGMPDSLKSGVENLSGMDLSDVKVHYNSSQPAQLNALAYAQGNDIHIAPGQEKHLAHEAWHVVQQRQGRVQATTQMKEGAVPVNDDPKLEHEADVMGAKALQKKEAVPVQRQLAINNRQADIANLQAAFNGIPAGGANATPAEIALHDNALGAGQHHANRAVGRNALRADLQNRIDLLNGYQARDNGRLPRLAPAAAAQLQTTGDVMNPES